MALSQALFYYDRAFRIPIDIINAVDDTLGIFIEKFGDSIPLNSINSLMSDQGTLSYFLKSNSFTTLQEARNLLFSTTIPIDSDRLDTILDYIVYHDQTVIGLSGLPDSRLIPFCQLPHAVNSKCVSTRNNKIDSIFFPHLRKKLKADLLVSENIHGKMMAPFDSLILSASTLMTSKALIDNISGHLIENDLKLLYWQVFDDDEMNETCLSDAVSIVLNKIGDKTCYSVLRLAVESMVKRMIGILGIRSHLKVVNSIVDEFAKVKFGLEQVENSSLSPLQIFPGNIRHQILMKLISGNTDLLKEDEDTLLSLSETKSIKSTEFGKTDSHVPNIVKEILEDPLHLLESFQKFFVISHPEFNPDKSNTDERKSQHEGSTIKAISTEGVDEGSLSIFLDLWSLLTKRILGSDPLLDSEADDSKTSPTHHKKNIESIGLFKCKGHLQQLKNEAKAKFEENGQGSVEAISNLRLPIATVQKCISNHAHHLTLSIRKIVNIQMNDRLLEIRRKMKGTLGGEVDELVRLRSRQIMKGTLSGKEEGERNSVLNELKENEDDTLPSTTTSNKDTEIMIFIVVGVILLLMIVIVTVILVLRRWKFNSVESIKHLSGSSGIIEGMQQQALVEALFKDNLLDHTYSKAKTTLV